MFDSLLTFLIASQLENILQKGEKQERAANVEILKFLKGCGYTSVTPQLRGLLTFCIGFFTGRMNSDDPVKAKMANVYATICYDISNKRLNLLNDD